MSRRLGPNELVAKLRNQARAMKAGPDSLLHQAADTIEAQQYELREKQDQLLRAAQMIAAATMPLPEEAS